MALRTTTFITPTPTISTANSDSSNEPPLLGRLLIHRQREAEGCATPRHIDQLDIATMQLQDPMHDPQPQPTITACAANIEWPQEQPFTQFGGDAGAGVADGHLNERALRPQAEFDFTALGRMAQGIVEQVGQHPFDQPQIGTSG